MPRAAYTALARYLLEIRRRDLLEPLASACAAVLALAVLIARAEADRDLASARRLKIESMRQRAAAEHAVHCIMEAVGDEGSDLVEELMGDGGRTLAQVLLGDDE